jgi:hypothetical protein
MTQKITDAEMMDAGNKRNHAGGFGYEKKNH